MALSKLEARNSSALMNWCGGVWPRSKILAKSSLIQTRVTLERKSAREHWFRAMTRDSVRPVSKPGSLSRQHKFRVRRNCEVPTNTHDALKWSRSSERLIYDVHKTNFGASMSHVRHDGSTGGQGNAAPVERPDIPARERRSDDYRGISAGQYGPNTPPQCTWVYLCAGRLHR